MAVVVYLESQKGTIKKTGFELASYGRAVADALGEQLIGVGFNLQDTKSINPYGMDVLYNVDTPEGSFFNADRYSSTIAGIASKEMAQVIVVSSSADGRYLGPLLSAKLHAAFLSNVVDLPTQYSPLKVKRSCFTNKAFNRTLSQKECNILSLSSNAFGLNEQQGDVEVRSEPYAEATTDLEVTAIDQATDKVSIADADIVVSGGRGLKGPENWHLIEDLASVLDAATACSKPVSDMGWRPHSEHVGQTGKPVASNLYIAIGVSGAIQHLAGINSSKVKVVINNDPEAPFFKAADYGIVGDAFEVVPKLIEKLKARKH